MSAPMQRGSVTVWWFSKWIALCLFSTWWISLLKRFPADWQTSWAREWLFTGIRWDRCTKRGGISTPACDPLGFHYWRMNQWARWEIRLVLEFQNTLQNVCTHVLMWTIVVHRTDLAHMAFRQLAQLLATVSVSRSEIPGMTLPTSCTQKQPASLIREDM